MNCTGCGIEHNNEPIFQLAEFQPLSSANREGKWVQIEAGREYCWRHPMPGDGAEDIE